jgi:hypothetical protein
VSGHLVRACLLVAHGSWRPPWHRWGSHPSACCHRGSPPTGHHKAAFRTIQALFSVHT